MENSDDMYDNYDADPSEGEPAKDDTEDVGAPFLVPKASFKGDLSPGTIHRVRIEESHDSELTVVCLGESNEPEAAPEPMPKDENAALYE